ncbi:hypothetical protein EDB86DRAFT_2929485 [Lactarius hatsudake]|nr:hypothetical protein EDB86DRAFT_2929485 [Lactarius hatsudake]
MAGTLGSSSHMMEGVIDISPSPELEPQTVYRPLHRKRPLSDGDDSAIELTDSTDSQSSAPYKRAKRRVRSRSGQNGSSSRASQTLRPAVTERTQRLRAQTPTSPPVPILPIVFPAVQGPHAHPTSFGEGSMQIMPPANPDHFQLPYNEWTFPPELLPLVREPSPPVATPVSEVEQESHEVLVERVREVVPDVLPAHVFNLLDQHKAAFSGNLLDVVIHALLEDSSYPKDLKGKGKARAAKEDSSDILKDDSTSINYANLDANRGRGPVYRGLCLSYLRSNFPTVDHTDLTRALSSHKGCYAPTYLYLLRHGVDLASAVPCSPQGAKIKRKLNSKAFLTEQEFMKEHTWLVKYMECHDGTTDPNPPVDGDGEDGIECGCCFSNYPFSEMAQCTDTHLFCKSCVTSYVSTQLGEQNSDLRCMDLSGCKMTFPDSELRRILTEKLFGLYEDIRQRRDIEQAGIEGLEECPFCDFRVVMDVDFDQDKLLRCQNEDCEKVSCRKCKKENHLPKSCEEAEEDTKLDGKHAVEEAMTRALMRNCPKCQKAFVKEYGCNKITCTFCHTISCYICRSIIRGYEHFDERRGGGGLRQSSGSKKCPLWDVADGRQAKEVAAAAEKALKEYKELHPDVRDEDIRVELPPPERRAQALPGRPLQVPPPPAYVQVHHANHAHIPIAHPVMAALPFPHGMPVFDFERLFAQGPPGFGELGPRPAPENEAQVMFPMPPGGAFNPLAPPFPMRALPPPPLQQALPPLHMALGHALRMAGRGRHRR